MTQYDLILGWFEKHEYLTVKVALQELGIYALSQRCGELHKRLVPRGLQIKSEMIKVIGRDGKPKHCARYSLIRTNESLAAEWYGRGLWSGAPPFLCNKTNIMK